MKLLYRGPMFKSMMNLNTTMIMDSVKSSSKLGGVDDKDEAQEDNGILFWINKSGFPIDDHTWDRMWEHVAKIHPDGYGMVNKVRGKKDLPQVPIPQPPLAFSPNLSIPDRLKKIQDYMNELQYNHTGTQFFEIRKNRPLSGLMESAKEMIREALPIKCLEAVILGIFLTNGMLGVERFTLSFKTVFRGNIHRHVVLGLSHGGYYGAIGMSRRDDLMYKAMEFKSLADLVIDFERCYMKYGHTLKKVKVGLPVIHDQHSYEIITWKGLMVNWAKTSHKELARDIDNHARRMKSLAKSWTTGPYSSLKMLTTADALKDFQPSSMESSLAKLRRSHTQVSTSPTGVRKKSVANHEPSAENDYQVRI